MIYLIDEFQLQAEYVAPSLLSSLYRSMTLFIDTKIPAWNGIRTFFPFLLTKYILNTVFEVIRDFGLFLKANG